MSSTRSQTSTSAQHSSTNNSNNNNQMMSNIFGANESPSLVVAFLAIGLFMVVMAALFGWRRMRRGRLVVQPARPVRVRGRPRKKPIAIGEKPTLWDMWTRRRDSEVTIDLKWENITPFCATRVFCRKEKPRRPVLMKATAVEPRNVPRSSFVMTRISAFREHFRLIRSPPPPPPPPPPPEPQAHELDDMSERPEGSFVVMAFTISMPSPGTSTKKRDNATNSEVSDRVSTPELLHDTELGEYCIGSVEVSCSEDR
ncbi:uncharacterized protein F5891DRAFT_1186666 [Suillus fuscotomentosus]|uniref:Uncharacterized protein n=1 Tax=Suillus fuscotomentosus TaxID=1912939 RepID=A0AAD4E9E0_9AGAM|nr:uncharacterized protein F5891DRAFT_1186666 [Suillus fuscotomentosus]KAG1902094.1 hypothetical protein F5891DRAFT_1186666 [Suillus fuscotomentosus]